MTTTVNYPAIIISNPSEVKTKTNGSTYVSMIVEFKDITDPNTNEPVRTFASFTLVNKEGKARELPAKDTEVVVYHSTFISTAEETKGKTLHHFEIGRNGIPVTSSDVLDSVFGV